MPEMEFPSGRRRLLQGLGLAGAAAAASTAAATTPSGIGGAGEAQAWTDPGARIADPSCIDQRLDCRSISFENPTGGRGAGGRAGRGRKGSPSRLIASGETVVLADVLGPGTVRHLWMTFNDGDPELQRAMRLEVYYDGRSEPSISVPVLDFFGLPHGRRAEYYSSLMGASSGRAFNSWLPLPFGRSMRIEFHNGAAQPIPLFYQLDYTLEPALPGATGFLHAAFRRENPTRRGRDFTIVEGLRGPGRYLGCVVGVRVLDAGDWYGEGEMKIFRDGDTDYPTYCGTGLEDYVGAGWGLRRHHGPYAGAPLDVRRPPGAGESEPMPVFVGFYRWHLLDPVMFARELRVTIQQMGYSEFHKGQETRFAAYRDSHPAACTGWQKPGAGEMAWLPPDETMLGMGCVERVDDYCATAFIYCSEAQAVPRLDTVAATRDIARQGFESNP